jgi:hypothetical protein
MSPIGTKQTSEGSRRMFALEGEADIARIGRRIGF